VRAARRVAGRTPTLAVVALATLLSTPSTPVTAATTSATTAPASESTAVAPDLRYPEKAGVILELIPFVEWPASSATSPPREFVIGVLGDERFAEALRSEAHGRTVRDRPIRIRNFRNLDEVDPCPILVIGRDKARLLPSVLDFLRDWRGILTVGDRAEFAAQGGIVELVELPGRVGFEINRDAAGLTGLRLSAQLLRLAERLLPAAATEPTENPGR